MKPTLRRPSLKPEFKRFQSLPLLQSGLKGRAWTPPLPATLDFGPEPSAMLAIAAAQLAARPLPETQVCE